MSNLKDNDNSNVALKSGVWYVISSIIVKSVAIISTPIFTRLMTVSDFGTISNFISWFSILSTFTTLNLGYSIGRAKLDFCGELNEYIGSMQILSAIFTGSLTCFCLVFLNYISCLLTLNKHLTILLLLYLLFSPIIGFVQNGYRYEYKYKQNIAIAWYLSFSTAIFSVVFILFLPVHKTVARGLGIVVPNCLLSLFLWCKYLKKKSISFDIQYWKYGLLLSIPLIPHTISMNVLGQSDRIVIARICGNSETGIYSLVYSYGVIISVVTGAIADGWLPWFHDNYYARNYKSIEVNSRKIVLLGCYLGLASVSFAPEAILMFGGKSYMSGLSCAFPIILGIVCQYIYTHYVNIELHLKKTKYVSLGTSFAALLNIVLNIVFVPKFGFVAAAYTTFISYFCLMVLHFFITRVILKVYIYNTYFMFGSLFITSFFGYVITYSYQHFLLRYIIIIIGFCSCVFVFRDYVKSFIKNKVLHG